MEELSVRVRSTLGMGRNLYSQIMEEKETGESAGRWVRTLGSYRKGLAVLELVCVNLFLYPWRKEIRTLKKFTGNFVYFVAPVIPEHTLSLILQRVGYTVVTKTEYIIGGMIKPEEAKHMAFELFLSRIQCDEVIRLIEEGKMDHVHLLFDSENRSERNTEHNIEKAEKAFTYNAEANDFTTLDGLNNTYVKGNEDQDKKKELKPKDDKFNIFITPNCNGQCDSNFTIANNSTYYYSNCLESEEFLNKYSDLNLAQKPIFPKHTVRVSHGNINEPMIDQLKNCKKSEPKDFVAQASELYDQATELHFTHSSQQGVKETVGNMRTGENEIINCTKQDKKTNSQKSSAVLGESSAEENNISKQLNHATSRSVIKLKLENIIDESLAYPVEETIPPCQNDSNEPSKCAPNNVFIKQKQLDCSSAFTTTDITNHISKTLEDSTDADNMSRIREPPSCTYIPPGGAGRQCLRITDLQPEENHFKAPSPPADMIFIDHTLHKMNADPREDFVVITRKTSS
ncbi:hypothetical protein GDO86_008358 [Hymenochirus boettgeri]|uniref:Spermatogenesis-associated protein 2 PUB-like domain-containing protein n=1 Tax=Hymenochirus boettgeri TaxID=247094 RepID=A0A8T2J030_9PIPI|nr:hypothetical protein GDO86_008358 [Hymenochirus boettgeri]